MAIDYIMNRDCPVKERLTAEGLVTLLKQRAAAEAILAAERRAGKSEEEARGQTLTWHLRTINAPDELKKFTIREVLDRTAVLDPLSDHCGDCPAGLGEAFGCAGAIAFPISRRCEEWLAGLLAASAVRKDPGALVASIILKEKLPGEPFASMRRDPRRTYFETGRPLLVKVGKGMAGRRAVSTDQLLDFLFRPERLEGRFLIVLAHFSGGLEVRADEPAEGTFQSASAMRDETGRESWWSFNLPEQEGDDRPIRQFKRFFHACFRAFQIECVMTCDL